MTWRQRGTAAGTLAKVLVSSPFTDARCAAGAAVCAGHSLATLGQLGQLTWACALHAQQVGTAVTASTRA